MARVLIVEDQKNLLRSLTKTMQESGFDAIGVESLQPARQALKQGVDLIVLDLMLTDGSGLDLLKEMRQSGSRIPILILTARDSIEDRVNGLDSGADDYLVKPFALDELLARIRVILRREARTDRSLLTFRDLKVDLVARTAHVGMELVTLQNRQLELLAYLMATPNQVVTREAIAKDVWKESTATWTNVIDVQINQLRKKLEQFGRSEILHTVRGQGYLLGDLP